MSSSLVYIVATLSAFSILRNPKACIRRQVILQLFMGSNDYAVFSVVATMVLPFVAFVQPYHTTTLLLTSKGDLVSLSGHTTRIAKTS